MERGVANPFVLGTDDHWLFARTRPFSQTSQGITIVDYGACGRCIRHQAAALQCTARLITWSYFCRLSPPGFLTCPGSLCPLEIVRRTSRRMPPVHRLPHVTRLSKFLPQDFIVTASCSLPPQLPCPLSPNSYCSKFEPRIFRVILLSSDANLRGRPLLGIPRASPHEVYVPSQPVSVELPDNAVGKRTTSNPSIALRRSYECSRRRQSRRPVCSEAARP
ncbi:hypothetical protein GQ53DRAFT_366636 [Thozetella sp. PMI_491]|nr:hypothetical protein GQ53DRAFT_366636 [Thozetella sp. PMI_491]